MNSVMKFDTIKSDTLIISFAGRDRIFGGIKTFEFVNFLENKFNTINRHFYIDTHLNSYHNGIRGITKNIDETVEYLKDIVINYKNVIFLGTSSGGYAAILFGSLLNINSVVAFIPQTFRTSKKVDEKYRDISQYINDTTKYCIYGDPSISDINHFHHISHCERISHHSNVFLTKKENFNLKQMRDSGELYDILIKLI